MKKLFFAFLALSLCFLSVAPLFAAAAAAPPAESAAIAVPAFSAPAPITVVVDIPAAVSQAVAFYIVVNVVLLAVMLALLIAAKTYGLPVRKRDVIVSEAKKPAGRKKREGPPKTPQVRRGRKAAEKPVPAKT